jgi:hypothetical protein
MRTDVAQRSTGTRRARQQACIAALAPETDVRLPLMRPMVTPKAAGSHNQQQGERRHQPLREPVRKIAWEVLR